MDDQKPMSHEYIGKINWTWWVLRWRERENMKLCKGLGGSRRSFREERRVGMIKIFYMHECNSQMTSKNIIFKKEGKNH